MNSFRTQLHSKIGLTGPGPQLRGLLPGLMAAVTVAMAAAFLAEHYQTPVMLLALLLGMAFRFLSEEGKAIAGIQVASGTLLRLGVALLGLRISWEQIAGLGYPLLGVILVAVAGTVALGALLAPTLGQRLSFGVMSGGSVGICGASAALAIATVLPPHPQRERDTLFVVVCVTALSTLAMILYPPLVSLLGLDAEQAGIFLGGTIHDVAQVVGAGYSVSDPAGDTATVIKLLRVALLVPVVFVLSLLLSTRRSGREGLRLPFPWFILLFIALMVVNSLGWLPKLLVQGLVEASRWCLITAIAALGMKTSLQSLFAAGWQPMLVLLLETLFIAGFVLIAVLTL